MCDKVNIKVVVVVMCVCALRILPYLFLLTHLLDSQEAPFLSTQELVFMAEQVARGMYHLTRKGLVHKDLAARNI